MTPGERDFLERHIALWGAKAAELRRRSDKHSYNRALGLQMIVDPMIARLAQAPAISPVDAEIAALEARLAKIQPRIQWGVMVADGEIMDRVRWRLACKIAALRCEPMPPEPVPPAPVIIAPPPDPVPFTMGPQMDLLL